MPDDLDRSEIWLVVASDGQYDDFTTWIASGWYSKAMAEEEAARLQKQSDAARQKRTDWWAACGDIEEEIAPGKNAWELTKEESARYEALVKERLDPEPAHPEAETEADDFSVQAVEISDA